MGAGVEMSLLELKSQPENPLELLEHSFHKFTEASARLQAKYETLVQEVSVLKLELHAKDLEIQQAQRLASLGETAAAIAHEVRNPLGAIKLFLSLLQAEISDRPQAQKIAEHIGTSIESLDNVVSNILHFSKSKRLTFAPLNMHSLVREQLLHFKPLHRDGASVELKLEGNPYIEGNEGALRQIIYNLLLNAFQATRYAGKIVVATNDDPSNAIALTIHDNGPGIAEEVLGTLFDPFVTTKNEGTGLGLAIVSQIVAEHTGSISVRNDCGAEFRVLLPRKPQR